MSESPRNPDRPGERHPAVDIRTATAPIILQERPVVPLTRWLSDAAQLCARESLLLQVLTPASSRLTIPLAALLRSADARWVVRAADGTYFDGLRGAVLDWDGQSFTAAGEVAAPDFLPARPPDAGSIDLDVTVLHPASEQTLVGSVAEECLLGLTGQAPYGWGVAEPATEQWDTGEITRFCRRRVPRPSELVVVGGAGRDGAQGTAVGTVIVRRVPSGVHEQLRLSVGSTGAPDLAALDQLAESLADRHSVRVMTAGLRPGRAGGTVEPRFSGHVVPYGMLFGAEAVETSGVEHALAAPAPHVLLVGPPARPGCWVRVVGGADPDSEPGTVLGRVLAHLVPATEGDAPAAGR